MTLLAIVQAAADELGIHRPASVVDSPDQTAIQMLALANREGKRLAKRNWTVLQTEHTFSTVDGTAAYALPSDFERFLFETEWNRTDGRRIAGPIPASEWQALKSGLVNPGITNRFRVKGNSSTSFFLDPTPSAAESLVFEYASNLWCESSGAVGQTAWAADTDVGRIDEDLMTLGLKWRWKAAKGFAYAEEKAEYDSAVETAYARDGGMRTLNLGSASDSLPDANIPETGIGV